MRKGKEKEMERDVIGNRSRSRIHKIEGTKWREQSGDRGGTTSEGVKAEEDQEVGRGVEIAKRKLQESAPVSTWGQGSPRC